MPRLYSPIEPGVNDESRWPVKPFALTPHERGVPITEMPEIWGVSSTSVMATVTIDSNEAATAVAITANPINFSDDAIQIDWYRGTTLMYSLVLGVLDAVRPAAVSVGDTMDDTNSQSFGETIGAEHRGFRQGRTSDNLILIQQDSNATVTLAQDDEIRVSTNVYETGVLGNKFARAQTAQTSTVWIKTRSASQPAAVPSGTTFNGNTAILSAGVTAAGWVPLRAVDPTGNDPLWYARATAEYSLSTLTWTVGAFTILSFPADRVESGLEIAFSSDGTTRHAAPQLTTDKYVHFRSTPNGAWQRVSINPVREQWIEVITGYSWFPSLSDGRRTLTFPGPIDLDEYSTMQIGVRGSVIARASTYPFLFPTNELYPTTSTDFAWQNGVSYALIVEPSGSSFIQTDSFRFPPGRWNGCTIYPYRNSGDSSRTIRGFRLFAALETGGNNGMIFSVHLH